MNVSESEGSEHFSQQKSEELKSPLVTNDSGKKTPKSKDKKLSKAQKRESEMSQGSYQAPSNVYYKSECQVKLDKWLVKYHQDSGSSTNTRGDLADEEIGEEGHVKLAAPQDANPVSQIESLHEWINTTGSLEQDPSTTFFELSRNYYNKQYKQGNKRAFNIRGYFGFETSRNQNQSGIGQGVLDTHDNHIEHLNMEVVQTTAGCRPFFKSYEANASTQQKFVKTLKFYDHLGDQSPLKQIIVDEGIMHENFQCYDTSILHFGNSIIFYKRDGLCHKLVQYNVITNMLMDIHGYELNESAGQQQRFHVMFSQEIGQIRTPSDIAAEEKMNVYEFLNTSGIFVLCQTYEIDQYRQMNYGKVQIWKPFSPQKKRGDQIYMGEKLKQIRSVQEPKIDGLVQYSCHHIESTCHLDPLTKVVNTTHSVTLIAFDQFYSHYFGLDARQEIQNSVATYYGNNETQMERNASNPFLKHQNIHFLIQKENVVLNKGQNKNIKCVQYYHITQDNQYMLIYPNYSHIEQKLEVLEQIAKKHQYNRDSEQEFKYDQDFAMRKSDYDNSTIKNITHISVDDYKTMNHMKKAEHVRAIVQYPRKFSHDDQIVMFTDQERSIVCVYQSSAGQTGLRQNRQTIYPVEMYTYTEKTLQASPIKHLPHQVIQIEEELEWGGNEANDKEGAEQRRRKKILAKNEKKKSDPEDVNQSYYANSRYRHVVSCPTHIKTTMVDEQDPYLNYTHRISEGDSEQFMIVENNNGSYLNIRIKQDDNENEIRLEMYNISTHYYTFFFSFVNDNDIRNRKHTYFAIRKTHEEIYEMGQDNHKSLITMDSDVYIITENKFDKSEIDIVKDYTRKMSFRQMESEQHNNNIEQTWNIYLIFEKIFDNKSNINFIPIIYQEKKSINTHHLLLFDVDKMQVVRHAVILPNLEMRKSMRKTFIGFCQYTITRSSELFNDTFGFLGSHHGQNVKYQVSTLCYLKKRGLYEHHEPGYEEEQPSNSAQSLIDISEFLVKHRQEGSHIHLIGRKQILLSQSAQRRRQETFDNLFFLPYFDTKGRVKGVRLVLRENDNKKGQSTNDVSEQPQKMISMKDQEGNNIYHYGSELIQFGHQKFLLGKPTEIIQDEYIVVISSQLTQKVYMKSNFENSESYFINQKVISKLLSQQLAKFENFVLNDDFDVLMREEYYQSQELLDGKSINDLCLNHPAYVTQGTEQNIKQISSISGSLAEELCEADDLKINNLKRFGLAEETLIIQMDFNFCTSIRIAMEMDRNQSVKVLMEKVFDINNIKYQDHFKIDLPIYLRQPGIQRLYDFLERDYEEQSEIDKLQNKSLSSPANAEQSFNPEFNNFEDFLNHPDLPPFAKDTCSYHVKERYRDYHNRENEVIQEVVAKNPYMTWGVTNFDNEKDGSKFDYERNVEVEHSCIDFTTVIIGEKIRGVLEQDFKIVTFNDEELATLMYIEEEENLDFYDLEVVRKIIDYQFSWVGRFLGHMFKVYLIGFVIPFLLTLSVESLALLNIFYTMCIFTQIFFIMFEIIQLKEQRLDYFKDIFNVIQVSQFASFAILYAYKMISQFERNGVFMLLLQTFVLIQSVINTVYYLRIYEQYAFVVEMGIQIMHKIWPFVLFVGISLIGFCKIYEVLNMGVVDPDNEMKDIHSPMFQMFFQTYRSSQGDKVIPSLTDEMANRLQSSPGAATILLLILSFVWIGQNTWFMFYGVQFLALIFQSYEELYSKMEMLNYRSRARMNMENYQILDVFFKPKEFKSICFAVDKDLRKQREQRYEGCVKTHRKFCVMQENLRIQERKDTAARHDALHQAQETTLDTIDDCLRDGFYLRQQIAQVTASLKPDLQSDGRRRCACQRL